MVASALLPVEEEALATQGQPEQPSGPADSAGVTLIEAVCARETVVPEYSVSGPARSWTAADCSRRIHEGMDMGCSRRRKERLDNLAQQDRDNPTPCPTPWESEHRPNEAPRGFKIHAMRAKRHSPQKIPGATLDSQSSFRDGLRCATALRLLRHPRFAEQDHPYISPRFLFSFRRFFSSPGPG